MNISVSLAIKKSSNEDALRAFFRRKYYSYIEPYREREIQTFNNFVKVKGAEENPKQRQQNSYKSILHWNLTYFLDFADGRMAKYTSFRSTLHILSTGYKISFNRNNPSMLIR